MSDWDSIRGIASSVKSGGVTARSLVDLALANIKKSSKTQAVVSTTAVRARQRAEEIDELIKSGDNPGRLAGVPFIAKDNFLTYGADTTAASNMLKGFEAPYQATVIEKLEAEGAICVAKANLDAFAHGSSTENSDFFTTLNPYDKTRVSDGSTASVALNLVPFALGTDTSGSIRTSASYCGVVGLKPTYGLVSRSGVIATASSLDTVGPITRSVEDTALLLDVMAGRDELDATTIERDSEGYLNLESDTQGKVVGVIKECMGKVANNSVRVIIEESTNSLKSAGVIIKEISIPSLPAALAAHYVICSAEISSNMSRYDGQRYGLSVGSADNLSDSYELARGLGFNAETKRRIMIGTYFLSSGYYDIYYKKAQMIRTKLIDEFAAAFKEVDFLLGPTAPDIAFKIGEYDQDPLGMYLTDIMTIAANLVGVPAISVPAGDVNKLPVGLQLMSAHRTDRALLGLANVYEKLQKEDK